MFNFLYFLMGLGCYVIIYSLMKISSIDSRRREHFESRNYMNEIDIK